MTTTVEAVERYLECDLILYGALDRGILNIRRAARWLIKEQGWDTTEEAVVSALRRYNPPRTYDMATAFHLLQASHLTARGGLASITVPRARRRLLKIPDIAQAMEPEDTFGLLPGRKQITFILEKHKLMEASRILEAKEPTVHEEVGRIDLHLPHRKEPASTSIAISLAILDYHGIEPMGVFGALPTCSMLLTPPSFIDAHGILTDLLQSGVSESTPTR